MSVDYLIGHETKSIIHADSLTPDQKVALELIRRLDEDTLKYEIGKLSALADVPLSEVREKMKNRNWMEV